MPQRSTLDTLARFLLLVTSLTYLGRVFYLLGFASFNAVDLDRFFEVNLVVLVSLHLARIALATERLLYLRSHFFYPALLILAAPFFVYELWVAPGGLSSTVAAWLFHFFLVGEFLISFSRHISIILRFGLRPPIVLALSFSFLIVLGFLLLLMPNATYHAIQPVDAFFTAVSAACVTGLSSLDTTQTFTPFGQAILLGLFQVGGFGIILLSYLLISLVRMNVSLQERLFFYDFIRDENSAHLAAALKKIFFTVVTIEALGTLLLWWSWYDDFSPGRGIFVSLFHAISAFCNAGFSVFNEGLVSAVARDNSPALFTIMFLITCGSLGFITLNDIFLRARATFTAERHRFSVTSKMVLASSFTLVLLATLLIFLTEKDHALQNMTLIESLQHSLFQAITLRTAGFSTIEFGQLLPATLFLMLLFMYIGGASGSTSGGVKINTVFASFLSIRSTLRGENKITFARRTINFEAVNKAVIILVSAMLLIFLSVLGLNFTDPALAQQNFLALVFEAVSAFGTVGLSQGVTAELSTGGKLILCLNMFIGRVGPLTLVMALTRPERFTNYEYPHENLIVG